MSPTLYSLSSKRFDPRLRTGGDGPSVTYYGCSQKLIHGANRTVHRPQPLAPQMGCDIFFTISKTSPLREPAGES